MTIALPLLRAMNVGAPASGFGRAICEWPHTGWITTLA